MIIMHNHVPSTSAEGTRYAEQLRARTSLISSSDRPSHCCRIASDHAAGEARRPHLFDGRERRLSAGSTPLVPSPDLSAHRCSHGRHPFAPSANCAVSFPARRPTCASDPPHGRSRSWKEPQAGAGPPLDVARRSAFAPTSAAAAPADEPQRCEPLLPTGPPAPGETGGTARSWQGCA